MLENMGKQNERSVKRMGKQNVRKYEYERNKKTAVKRGGIEEGKIIHKIESIDRCVEEE